MLEITLGALRPADKIDLKVPTSKLLFAGTITKTAGTTARQAWETATGAARVTSTRYSQDKGNKQQAENIKLLDLAEIAANNEGYIQLDGLDADTTVTVKFTIELSNSGSVALDAKDYFTVQFSGFGGFTNLEVRSFGAPVKYDEHLKYSPVACNANAQVTFNCVSHYAIALPSAMVKLTLNYANGETQEIEGDDLELISADWNEILYLINGTVIPTGEWRLFPLPSAERGKVTLSEDGFCYLLSNKNYEA